ncbi:MAG: HNH endonuclease [Phycisphaerae bacterium]|nr:HNH endonuclease [Phycisphaerae bacterium]
MRGWMGGRPANDGQPWTREQLILAFELYCRIPFQRTKATDARVKELAALLHRTPASVARKLGNFGAFDPQLSARNISGLTHGSKLDKAIWDEFHADWNGLIVRAHDLRREREPQKPADAPAIRPTGPSEKLVTVKQRLHQSFFRDAVISSYNARCCVTGIPIVECLVAGHIIPWSVDERRRADPTNGVCLSATFDRLFDCGLVTIRDDLTLRVSERVLRMKDGAAADLVAARHGQPIIPPARFYPDPACLRWHRENRFQAA